MDDTPNVTDKMTYKHKNKSHRKTKHIYYSFTSGVFGPLIAASIFWAVSPILLSGNVCLNQSVIYPMLGKYGHKIAVWSLNAFNILIIFPNTAISTVLYSQVWVCSFPET